MSRPRVRLIHWNADEARSRIEQLAAAGHTVEFEPISGSRVLARLSQRPPHAVLIDLTRLPTQGRDVGVWLRRRRATRKVPLLFVGGAADKVRAVRQLLPDAVYCGWEDCNRALKRALARPPRDPVVPGSQLAGYSGTPLPKKLAIKPGHVVALVNAPDDIEEILGELPEGVSLRRSGRARRDLTLCFVESRSQLKRRIGRLAVVAEQGGVWIAWPKKTAPRAGDVGEADVRRAGLEAGLVDYKICAIDETWSGLLFALRRDG